MQVACISLQQKMWRISNVADVKLETNIVEKHPFAVKEKTTYCTLSRYYDHATIANVMFCYQ